MKKLLFAASLFAASFSVNAQEYKPTSGDVTAEVGLTGGLLATTTNLNTSGVGLPQLKFRYFVADDLAVRVGLNLSRSSETVNVYEGAGLSGEGSRKFSNSNTLLNLGVEKHLGGTDRLSTYVGADLTINFAGAKEKRENYSAGAYAKDFNSEYKNYNANGDNASTGFGLRAVVGAEYYFIEKVYLGAEFGWGFLTSKNKDRELKNTPGTGNPTTTTETKSTGKEFNVAPATIAAVKIGFRF